MFEVGWTEMLVIAIVMIVVVGPKDLPQMLRTFGRTAAKLRAMAGDFQKQFNEALKEAELDDVKKSVDALRGLNPMNEVRKTLNPFEKAAADVRSGLDGVMKPRPAADPSAAPAATPQPAEPLKNGATEMPGVGAPQPLPDPPAFPAMTDGDVVARAGDAAVAAEPVKLASTAAPAVAAGTVAPAAPAPAKAVAGRTAGSARSAPVKTAPARAVSAKAVAKKAVPTKPVEAVPAGATVAAKSAPATKAAAPKAAKPAALKSPAKANNTPATAAKKKTAGT